jgi:anti-sigma regulatory factor (Ser/Thr protein kinase)
MMNDSDHLHLELPSDPCELAGVRQAVHDWASREGWEADEIAHVALAVDEALTNVIRHGYDGCTTNRMLVDIRGVRDSAGRSGVEIEVRDFGKQVDPDKICGRDLDDIRPGGLGVHIIRSVMDIVEYSRAEDCGMRLVMRKYRGTGLKPVRNSPPTEQA